MAHRLDEELAHRLGADEQHRPQRRVDEDDAALAIDDDHALLHGLEDAALQIALGAELAQGRGEAAGEPVERVSELDQLVLPLEAGAHGEVALGHAPRGIGERAHRRGHALGDHVREEHRERQRDHRAAPDEPAAVGLDGVDLRERLGDPGDADGGASVTEGHGGVHQVLADRRAEPLARPLAGREGGLHLGPRRVVVHAGEVRQRDLGVAEHEPVGPDEGDPAPGRSADGVRQAIPRRTVGLAERRGEARGVAGHERGRGRPRSARMTSVMWVASVGIRYGVGRSRRHHDEGDREDEELRADAFHKGLRRARGGCTPGTRARVAAA